MRATDTGQEQPSLGSMTAPETSGDPTRGPRGGAHERPPWPGSTGQGAFPVWVRQPNGPAERIRRANRQMFFLLGELQAATTEVEREVIREWIDATRGERASSEEALARKPRRSSRRRT